MRRSSILSDKAAAMLCRRDGSRTWSRNMSMGSLSLCSRCIRAGVVRRLRSIRAIVLLSWCRPRRIVRALPVSFLRSRTALPHMIRLCYVLL